ncbi:MAG: DUF2157 domain-containing protein [Betaproteobacteria bacterium]|nr:DUF2157 domain-containing protein [Betaproteobacteria bacterium]
MSAAAPERAPLRDVSRADIDHWTHAGLFDAAQRDAALRLVGATPDAAAWHRFLAQLFLFSGTLFLTAALGYFVAYNWNAMGRFAKIGLLEIAVAVPAILALVMQDGLQRRAALCGAFLATGPLLAYIGQTYQTGADPWELFAAWSALTLPWLVVARWRPAWAVWLVIVNVGLQLYLAEVWQPVVLDWRESAHLASVIVVNAVALALLERFASAIHGAGRIAERLCVLAIAAGATLLFCLFVMDSQVRQAWHLPVAALALGLTGWWYRARQLDVVALGFVSLGVIACAVVLTAKVLSELHFKSGAFLFGGMVAIGLSAMAGQWLTRLSRGQEAA